MAVRREQRDTRWPNAVRAVDNCRVRVGTVGLQQTERTWERHLRARARGCDALEPSAVLALQGQSRHVCWPLLAVDGSAQQSESRSSQKQKL